MYFAKVIHDLLLALRLPLRVVVHRVPELARSFFPMRPGQLRHLRRDALHFLQPISWTSEGATFIVVIIFTASA